MTRIATLLAALALAAAAQAQAVGGPPVFHIFYEQAPAVRERLQAARDAHEELELLAVDARLNTEKARSLEEARSRALEDVSALRVQAMLRVYEVLSLEQRAQVVRLHGDE